MKKIIIPIGFLIMGNVQAQVSNTENYIQSKTYLDYNGTTPTKISETVQYFDGLGRPKQIVNVKASPLGRDVVTHIEYDQFGRQVKDYLPVPQGGTLNGAIVPNPLANATQPGIYGQEKIYAEKILENSPLDRIQQQIQVGNDWAGKPVKFEYNANIWEDYVRKYETSTTWVEGRTQTSIQLLQYFQASQLYKNIVTDEDGNKTIEFKNGKGQLILSRKPLNTENADTYYVYNEYDQLAFVIPPLASAPTIEPATVENLYYQYRYDGRNHLVEKKLPGKGWEYMIYDKADRLVMTQDANLKGKSQWHITEYDALNRIVYTGLIFNSASRNDLQGYVSGNPINNIKRSTSYFTVNGMDAYYNMSPTVIVNILLSVNYYDTYPPYSFNPSFPSTIQGESVLSDTPAADGRSTKGLPVMSVVKNIEDDNWTKNYTYYDTKGRAIGGHSINHLGGYTKTESKLDFAGVPQTVVTKHKRLSNDTERMITENFEYDTQNRLLVHKHQVDSNTVEILAQNTYNELSQLSNKKIGGTSLGSSLQSIDYAYNIRGWMTKINDPANLNGKLFGYAIRYNNPVNTPYAPGRYNGNIAEVDWRTSNDNILKRYSYSYYAQNRLMFGHYSEPLATVPENSLYDEYLEYDLNGNITILSRNSKNRTSGAAIHIDNLGYTYEGNRLLKVTDGTQNNEGYPIGGNTIGYDNNGNITNHLDKGIQTIQYNFLNLPNNIKIDRGSGVFTSTTTYLYKADGSKLKKQYNYQQKNPTGVFDTSESFIDYLDGFQYSLEAIPGGAGCPKCPKPTLTLKFVPTTEGYYDFIDNSYIYNYTDHLGNVRLGYKKGISGLEVIEENNYYPFGLQHSGYNEFVGNSSYQYKYNGKELQRETGMYDYGARMYMPDLGRWGVVDPLAEKMRRWSPYNYAFDNPIRFIDPDGRAPLNEYDQNGKMISNLGGNKIDFFHQRNGDTKVVNRQSGASNLITGGESIIRGYTQRGKDVGWGTITGEYFGGSGPARSLFSDFNNSNHGPFASLDKASSPYSSLARQASLNSQDPKGFVEMTYLQANPLRANFDGNEQMWGRSTVSWYKLGDETLFLMLDSKSQESLFYRLPVNNFERTEGKVNSFGNTYQTYMWTESNSEIGQKVYDQFNPKIPNSNDKSWKKAASDYIKNGTP
ncbi:DUF6443 domain-containing protein [Chryseobacterium sp. KMC2]|uniref:DUF6443 domain-containing protein n=1 Tax=Chryseobacterium sp. KMC2 TaxID=2800705 RepID=UPI001923BF39|nr:DUF6443 domain-containing protein [Chryseobacterium sp. KMC2]MBL3549461.1 RHS repeat-associated core domain-containing protein [Chryseobacterium sp. KMC2]